MPSPYRFRTTGMDNWQAIPGYRYQSPQHATLERPTGKGSIRAVLVILASFAVAILLIVAWGF